MLGYGGVVGRVPGRRQCTLAGLSRLLKGISQLPGDQRLATALQAPGGSAEHPCGGPVAQHTPAQVTALRPGHGKLGRCPSCHADGSAG